jgi:hypothetical protein
MNEVRAVKQVVQDMVAEYIDAVDHVATELGQAAAE